MIGESTASNGGRYLALSCLSVGSLLLAWFVATNVGLIAAEVLPTPQAIGREIANVIVHGYTGKPLWLHAAASLLRTLVGLAAALLIGIPVGLLVGASRTVNALLTPIFAFLRPVPAIALIPLIILYFGIGEFSKVFVIFITATLYVILNASAGVKSVPQDLIRAGVNMGLTRGQLFRHVILPASAPHIMTGIKTATAVSWALVVASELIAAQVGLGYMIMDAATFYRIPDVYIAIAIIGVIGLVLETLESYAERRILHWRGR
jgi:ABC-type nitrate/sulfonate/bicarbonate transport system permease component